MSTPEVGFERIETLSPETVSQLLAHHRDLGTWPKKFMRMGINGMDRPSTYETCSLFRIPIRRHKEIMSLVPAKFGDISVVRYFLKIPAKQGFLDGQSYWMDKARPIHVVAWSLTDGNKINVSTPYAANSSRRDLLTEGNIAFVNGKPIILDRNSKIKHADAELTHVQTAPKTHVFNKGEGFLMNLSRYHEIVKADEDRLWFCLGVVPGGVK